MTGWGQLSLRARTALDRMAWGFGDCKRVLLEHGGWPGVAATAVDLGGQRWTVIGTRLLKLKRPGKRKPSGLLVPESECLWGSLRLPAMPRGALAAGVEEALWRVSPMPPQQIVAAWEAEPLAEGGWLVHWGMCRRAALSQPMEQQGLPHDAGVYLARQGRAFPVRNTAWKTRDTRQRWADWGGIALLIAVGAALSLPALMPLVLKRQAVVSAVAHVSQLEAKAAPLRQKMDELRRQADLADELRKNARTDLPLASVIDVLSGAIPADTWLDRIEVNGNEVRITGLTANATELIAQLGRQPALTDVRATGANVRDGTLNKERFTFEMRWRGEGARP